MDKKKIVVGIIIFVLILFIGFNIWRGITIQNYTKEFHLELGDASLEGMSLNLSYNCKNISVLESECDDSIESINITKESCVLLLESARLIGCDISEDLSWLLEKENKTYNSLITADPLSVSILKGEEWEGYQAIYYELIGQAFLGVSFIESMMDSEGEIYQSIISGNHTTMINSAKKLDVASIQLTQFEINDPTDFDPIKSLIGLKSENAFRKTTLYENELNLRSLKRFNESLINGTTAQQLARAIEILNIAKNVERRNEKDRVDILGRKVFVKELTPN
jgi:hypothetical protein